MTNLEWEEIKDEPGDGLSRMKIPGGWLVRNRIDVVDYTGWTERRSEYMTMCFVPDPEHLWEV